MPRPLIEPTLRALRLANTALDALFYDVSAVVTDLLLHGSIVVAEAEGAPSWRISEMTKAFSQLDLSALSNPEGSILVVDSGRPPHVGEGDIPPECRGVDFDLLKAARTVWEEALAGLGLGGIWKCTFIQEQRVFAARAVQKADARPGGVLGAAGHDGPPLLHYLPTARHTWRSQLNLTRLPSEVTGVRREGSRIETIPMTIKGPEGRLLDTAVPKVAITKDASYWDDGPPDPEAEVDLIAMIDRMLKTAPLSGFVVEGFTPYGRSASNARTRLMMRAVHSGLPVVRVGRGNTEGFVPLVNPAFIGGSNLTATKARLLLMACLMKFGALPPAANPDQPTAEETAASHGKVAEYQAIFNTH